MQRRAWVLVLCTGALLVAGWYLRRSLDDDAPRPLAPVPVAIASGPTARATPRSPVPLAGGHATVRGTVRDDAGAVIAGARVCAARSRAQGDAEAPEERCTSTADDGRFELARIAVATLGLAATAPGFQPHAAWLADGLAEGAERTLDLVLARGGVRVRGRVTDLHGHPVANAQVTEASSAAVEARTLGDGAFELWVAPGAVRLGVRAEGYAAHVRRVVAPAEVELALPPGAAIAGVVVDGAGAPVASAVLALDGDEDATDPQRVRAHADGTFRITGLAAGAYQLRALGAGVAGRVPVMVALGVQLDGIAVRVAAAFQIGVHVQRADGAPCPAGTATLVDRTGPPGLAAGLPRRAAGAIVIDGVAAGSYEVALACGPSTVTETLDVAGDLDVTYRVPDRPPSGTLRIVAEAPGYLPGEGEGLFVAIRRDGRSYSLTVPGHRVVVEDVAPGEYRLRLVSTSSEGDERIVRVLAGQTTEQILRIAPPHLGRLRVVTEDREGRVLGDVALRIVGAQIERTTQSNAEGEATLYLPTGTYEVAHGTQVVRAQVAPGTTRDIRLAVTPARIVRGTVVDTSGQPVPQAIVTRVGAAPGDERLTDAAGAFRYAVAGGGAIALVAARVGGGVSPPVVTDGASPIELVIGAGATLAGRVVTAGGRPAPQATVALLDETRGVAIGERQVMEGAFTWHGLLPCAYRVTVRAQGAMQTTPVTIAAAGRTTSVSITVPDGVAVAGRVIDAVSSAPLAHQWISLRRTDADGASDERPSHRITDADGRFAFDALVPGRYQLDVAAGASYLATTRTVAVARVDLDLGDITIARARVP